MENQHRMIKNYRDLTQVEIDLMNKVKEKEAEVLELLELINLVPETDDRWVSIAKTDLEKGFMALVRSIARPGSNT